MGSGFTGADPDDLDTAATGLAAVEKVLAAAEHPLTATPRALGNACDVPELAASLRRFGAAASAMLIEIDHQVVAAGTLAGNAAADLRDISGH